MIRAFEHSHGTSSTTDSVRKFCSQFSSFLSAVVLIAKNAFIGISLDDIIMDFDAFIIDLDFFSFFEDLISYGGLRRRSAMSHNSRSSMSFLSADVNLCNLAIRSRFSGSLSASFRMQRSFVRMSRTIGSALTAANCCGSARTAARAAAVSPCPM